MTTMGMASLSLLLTLLVLNLHHQVPDRRISPRMRTVMFGIMAKLLGLKDTHVRFSPNVNKIAPEDSQTPVVVLDDETTVISDKQSNNMNVKGREEKEVCEAVIREEWVAAARVLDRVFLYIFLLIIVTLIVILLGVYPATKPPLTGPIGVSSTAT